MRRGRRGDPPSPRLRGTGKSSGRLRSLISTLITTIWMLSIVAVYFRLQFQRVLELAGAVP